jgi:hypothetical protein
LEIGSIEGVLEEYWKSTGRVLEEYWKSTGRVSNVESCVFANNGYRFDEFYIE